MGERRAVAATIVAAMVFSSLLVSSYTMALSTDELATYYSAADLENILHEGAAIGVAVGAIGILSAFQRFASSRVFSCANATAVVDAAISTLSERVIAGGVVTLSTATPATRPLADDTLPMAKPFGGFLAGGTNLLVKSSSVGSSLGGQVTLRDVEYHVVSLPLNTSKAASFCAGASHALAAAAASSGNECSASSLPAAVRSAVSEMTSRANSVGLLFSANLVPDQASSCGFSLSLRVTQAGLAGPLGGFSWTVGEVLLPSAQGGA